jgi:hypothetical protein
MLERMKVSPEFKKISPNIENDKIMSSLTDELLKALEAKKC